MNRAIAEALRMTNATLATLQGTPVGAATDARAQLAYLCGVLSATAATQLLAADPAGLLVAATDADTAGRRYAARLAALAAEAGVRFDAILPPFGANDWNDALRAMAAADRSAVPVSRGTDQENP